VRPNFLQILLISGKINKFRTIAQAINFSPYKKIVLVAEFCIVSRPENIPGLATLKEKGEPFYSRKKLLCWEIIRAKDCLLMIIVIGCLQALIEVKNDRLDIATLFYPILYYTGHCTTVKSMLYREPYFRP
jgi:hypothetical protein